MAKSRDYRAEYAIRVERGLAKGLSRSQARGHPKATEAHVSPKAKVPNYDLRLEQGLKALRKGESLTQAARSIHVAPERLSHYLHRSGVQVEKHKGRWRVMQDDRLREVMIFSGGKEKIIQVRGYDSAVEVGRYMAAVGQFLADNDPRFLEPFKGRSVIDAAGKAHPLETSPNVLYRLDQAGGASFEQVYRIVV